MLLRRIPLLSVVISTTPLFTCLYKLQNVGMTEAAGESPLFDVEVFSDSDESYLQNFCDIHRQVESGEIARRDALRGLNLSVALGDYYTIEEDGQIKIDDNNQVSIAVQVLDHLAQNAGFSWRSSYGILPSPPEDKTWTDLLLWATNKYDIMGDYWGHTNERMSLGILFPVGFFDFSLIMIRKSAQQDTFKFAAIFDPFHWKLWLLLVGVIIMTGVVYYIVDLLDSRRLKKKPDRKSLSWSLYSSAISFTDGHCAYEPKSIPTSLVTLSTGLIFVIVISSYTANLTNFLISKESGGLKIDDIRDALNNKLDFCVWRGTPAHDYLKAEKANIIPKDSQEEVYQSISTEECDIALVTKDGYHKFVRDKEYNADCNLEWVGRTVLFEKGGFALADSVDNCSSLVRDVFDIYIREMDQSNELENMKQEFLKRVGSIDCEQKENEEKDSIKLTVVNMGGILIIHGGSLIIALVISLLCFYFQSEDKRRTMSESIRKSMFEKDSKKISDAVEKATISESHITMEDISNLCQEMIQVHDDAIDEKFVALNTKLDTNFDLIHNRDSDLSVGGDVSVLSFFGKKKPATKGVNFAQE